MITIITDYANIFGFLDCQSIFQPHVNTNALPAPPQRYEIDNLKQRGDYINSSLFSSSPSPPPPYNISEEIDKVNHILLKRQRFKSRKLFNRKVCVAGIAILVLLAVTVIPLIYISKSQSNISDDFASTTISHIETTSKTTTEISTEPSISVETSSSSTTSTSFQSTTTTSEVPTEPPDPYLFITRKEWGSYDEDFKGEIKLKEVKRIIVMDTKNKTCYNFENCTKFMKDWQWSTFMQKEFGRIEVTDIRENFLISSDGTVFEGRGFAFEGQHTYDAMKTSYNKGAIGISFVGDYTELNITEDQKNSFNFYIDKWISDGNISSNYSLYHRQQLRKDPDDALSEDVKSWRNWKSSEFSLFNRYINDG